MSMYLDVINPAIAGESRNTVQNWNNKIEIETISYDVSQHASVEVGTGLVASGSNVGHLSITKVMDKSTPFLWYHLAAGIPIKAMAIRVSRSGHAGGPFEAETYILENVIVSSYGTSGSPGAGGLPEESWSFSFTSMTERYQTVGDDGQPLPAETQGYDFGASTVYASNLSQAQTVSGTPGGKGNLA